jgi:hypothetical protein
MKCFFAATCAIFLLYSCNPLERSAVSAEEAIPDEAALIFKLNDPASLRRALRNNEFILKSLKADGNKSLFHPLKIVEMLESDSLGYLVLMPHTTDSVAPYLYISDAGKMAFKSDSLSPTDHHSLMVEGQKVEAYKTKGQQWYYARPGNLNYISNDSSLLAEQITKAPTSRPNTQLLPLFETSVSGKTVSLYVNGQLADSLRYEKNENSWSALANWLALDLNASEDMLQWTGVGIANDSTASVLSLFKNTPPVVNTLAKLAPVEADALFAVSFSDAGEFARNQRGQYPSAVFKDSLFNTTEELGIVYYDDKRAVLINTYGALALSEYLQESRNLVYDYQGREIGNLDKDPFLELAFPALIKDFKATHYTILDNAFIFSEDKSVVELILRNINSGATFETSRLYNSALGEIAEASSILLIADNIKLKKQLTDLLPGSLLPTGGVGATSDAVFVFQIVADRTFCHLNLFTKRKTSTVKQQGVRPRFTVQLDAGLANVPQFVTDHRNNKKEIVVQDVENNLYLISTDGKILWKKPLEGRVQGKIEQIDLYKNGRLQLAFTTSNQFLVLDRNGKEVAPFNMTYSGPVLNPLAVFDYEGNRNYRFVVTQGSDIKMFNGKGQPVSGFKYTRSESAVLDLPKHFRIGSRDYLVFKLEDGSLKILNRVGDTRVKMSDRIDFSDNDVFLNNNRFVVTDKTGTLFAIDTKGKVTKTRFNLAEDHGMDATSKTLSLMNDNELSIKGNKASLDLGVYTKPRIFYIYDKIYVSVTDIQTQRAYVFDSNAVLFPNFPVYSNSAIDLTDMDNDRSIEIVGKFEENSLIVYTIN